MRYLYKFFSRGELPTLAKFLEAREAEQWDIVKLQFMEDGSAHLLLALDEERESGRLRYRNTAGRVVM